MKQLILVLLLICNSIFSANSPSLTGWTTLSQGNISKARYPLLVMAGLFIVAFLLFNYSQYGCAA